MTEKLGLLPELRIGHDVRHLLDPNQGVRILPAHLGGQGMSFDQEDRQKQSRMDAVADQIKERFCIGATYQGSGLASTGACTVDVRPVIE